MSLSRNTPRGDIQIRKLEQRIQDEQARLHRMILQGVATQAGDDQVRRLQATLRQMKAHRPRLL